MNKIKETISCYTWHRNNYLKECNFVCVFMSRETVTLDKAALKVLQQKLKHQTENNDS